ncbi:metallophosphoesterase family protein [Lachnobacterium bovis]|uniref:Predicted phosphoesterase n=1 Tax=Lachnobacterium bovis DSM 14045 TaxID=1122142 RepID=A0A1H3LPN6_9FIRM|nr:metallophosphoesterase [Lachnobacterium bovis]SDY66371.1 Predicted phosphoesterase [Lachnobacterium bovis DSM 14045]
MRILCLADEESKLFWDYFRKDYFEDIDLIISCGDLNSSYLTFIETMTSIPLLYVRGNHDDSYRDKAPEGCVCIEDKIVNINGVKIMGLGGSQRYRAGGRNQYTEKEMLHRYKKLKKKIWFNKGIDILVTHAPAKGFHDGDDLCHTGFEVFNHIIKKYEPKYFLHGHVHMNYGRNFPREDVIGKTRVINAFEKYIIEI